MTHDATSDPSAPHGQGYTVALPQPGDWVAERFQITRPLGQGGFGTVYEAWQESMGHRRVALKILAPRNTHEPNAVERFRQEALLASRLSHPNTITLFDFGHTRSGLFYIAMEYLEGEPLSQSLHRGGPMDLPRVEHITRQLLRSLAEAHSIGLIHRDLKPDNIFLCPIFGDPDFVKVLDFGLAKIAGVLDDPQQGTSRATLPTGARTDLTLEGLVCGTPEYMAPEQARGVEPLTSSCDVYAVGLLIYSMLSGQKPFVGDTPIEVLQQQIHSPLPQLGIDAPSSRLLQVMRIATRKDPDTRYADASAMLYALTGRLPIDPTLRPSSYGPGRTLPPVGGDAAAAQHAAAHDSGERSAPASQNARLSMPSDAFKTFDMRDAHPAALDAFKTFDMRDAHPAASSAPTPPRVHDARQATVDNPFGASVDLSLGGLDVEASAASAPNDWSSAPKTIVNPDAQPVATPDVPERDELAPHDVTFHSLTPIPAPASSPAFVDEDINEERTDPTLHLDALLASPASTYDEPSSGDASGDLERLANASAGRLDKPSADDDGSTLTSTRPQDLSLTGAEQHLIGREREIRALVRALRPDAPHQVVLLEGNAGVGKSRMLSETLGAMRDAAAPFWVAGGWFRSLSAPPLDGIRTLLADLFNLDFSRLDRWPEAALKPHIRHLIADLSLTLSDDAIDAFCRVLTQPAQGPAPRPALNRSTGVAALSRSASVAALSRSAGVRALSRSTAATALLPPHTLDLVADGLLSLARQRPLTLVFEDIGHADRSSLDVLRRLVPAPTGPGAPPPPLRLLCTYRPEILPQRPSLRAWLSALDQRIPSPVQRVPLGALSQEACETLLDGLLPLTPELRSRIATLAAGNPLYAQRLLTHLVQSQHLTCHNDRWQLKPSTGGAISLPDDLTSLIRDHIATVIEHSSAPEAMQELLYRLAVLGRRVPVSLLHLAVGLEERPWPRSLIERLLGELRDAALITSAPHRLNPDRDRLHDTDPTLDLQTLALTFTNGILFELLQREVAQTLAGARLHRTAARAKAQLYADHPHAIADDLAQHYIHARTPIEAVPHLMRAGHHREVCGQLHDALARYADAEAILVQQPDPDLDLLARVRLRLGWLSLAQGRLDDAAVAFNAIIAPPADSDPAALDQPDPFEHAQHAASAHLGLARCGLLRADVERGNHHLQAAQVYSHQSQDARLILRTTAALSEHAQWTAQPRVLPSEDDLLALVRDIDPSHDPTSHAVVLRHVGLRAVLARDAQRGRDTLARALNLLRDAPTTAQRTPHEPDLIARASLDLAWAHRACGDAIEAYSLVQDALQRFEALDAAIEHAEAQALLGMLHWASGSQDEAQRLLTESSHTLERSGALLPFGLTLERLGQLYESDGNLRQALHTYQRALDARAKLAPHTCAALRLRQGIVLKRLDQPEAALAELMRAQHLYEIPPHTGLPAEGLCALGILTSWSGDQASARDLLRHAVVSARDRDQPNVQTRALAALALVLHLSDATFAEAERSLHVAQGLLRTHRLLSLAPLTQAIQAVVEGRSARHLLGPLPETYRDWIGRIVRLKATHGIH